MFVFLLLLVVHLPHVVAHHDARAPLAFLRGKQVLTVFWQPHHHLVPLPIPHLLEASEPRAQHTTDTHTHARHTLHRPPPSSSHPLYISNAPRAASTRRRRPPSITPAQRPLRVRSLASAMDPGHLAGTFLEDRVCVPSRENKPGQWQAREGIGKRRAHPPTHHSASDAPAVPDPGTTGANDAAEQVAGAAATASCSQTPAQPRRVSLQSPRCTAAQLPLPLHTFAQAPPPQYMLTEPCPVVHFRPPPYMFTQTPPLSLNSA
ncbi:hypothetical protein PLICRDRAFT_180324 [Plicaturopsis crispa FD-325 SS-3]|uniref:Secreted protein n=1 Tax=Plicaturopsis crispa FD-325 SS-3 TaxID=944288 RepID=A0A0C9SQB3_PLICR|nr:hypothetical protein PLICRDRAFT_180324 [Plicaturopsis crispa FD-325 SS-3]